MNTNDMDSVLDLIRAEFFKWQGRQLDKGECDQVWSEIGWHQDSLDETDFIINLERGTGLLFDNDELNAAFYSPGSTPRHLAMCIMEKAKRTRSAQQVDSAEASTIAVPPFGPSGSPR